MRNKSFYLIWLLMLLLYGGCQKSDHTQRPADNTHDMPVRINVFFSQTEGNYKEGGGIDMRLIADIDASEEEVLVAIYQITNDRIRDALIRAHRRDINVTVVTDDHTRQSSEDIATLQRYGIAVYDDASASALMHHKFTVIDRRIVWTGSCNYTYYAFYRNHENLVSVKSSTIADVYRNEFKELLTHHEVTDPYLSDTIEIYFSPEDDFQRRLIELIKGARNRIEFLAFAFTSRSVANALLTKAREGVSVRGVFDRQQNSYQKSSEYDYLLQNGVEVYLDANPFRLHDKVMIIDDTVVTGSYNFTEKANDTNFENSLVVHSREFARRYRTEFEKIFARAKEEARKSR